MFQEINSILSLFKIPIKFIEKPCLEKPYWIVELPSEDCAKKIASRSVLMKNCIELWSRAKSIDQLHINLRKSLQNTTSKWIFENVECAEHICPKELIDVCCSPNSSFKIEVETFCKHFSIQEKLDKIEVCNK